MTKVFTYGYDNGDNRRSKRDALTRFDITSCSDGTTSGTFTYDELDRIIASSEGAETYTYDGKGNHLTLQSSIQMPHRDNIDYTYNQAEQLSGITRNQTSVSYKYNGDGLMTERSITKSGQATTTRYYYDGANIIAESTVAADGSVTFKARYVRGAQLIYREDASRRSKRNALIRFDNQKAYYQHNGHGDVTGLVKADGTALNSYTYDIWGNPLTANVQVENPFGYSGEFWDEDTGLQYLRSRWYDPSIGRFIQEDTFEGYVNRPSSLNPYTYVENNPLTYVDPSGHYFERSAGSGGGGGGSRSSGGGGSGGAGGAGNAGTVGGTRLSKQSQTSSKPAKHLKYDPAAIGPHTTFKRDGTTNEITHYHNWEPAAHPKNPNKFTPGNRYDRKGPSHVNKVTGEDVAVPHVHDKSVPGGIRPARSDEIPLTGYTKRD